VDFGELDPEATDDLDQIIEPIEGLDFVIVIHQKVAATCTLLEKHDPFTGIRRVLDDMGGRDKALCVALPHVLSLHRDSINDNAATAGL
jgi:hypothetical protein